MSEEQIEETRPVDQPLPLADRLAAALPRLSGKQREIALFMLDNQEYVALASTSDVGTRTGSSAATVVRFCQAMGYQGYVDLQLAVREGVFPRRTAVQRLEDRLANPLPGNDMLARVFATDVQNIERTRSLISSGRVQAAVDEFCRARRILVVGDGLAAGLVEFFVHSLKVLGLPAQSVAGGGEPLALALAFLEPDDLVVGIGFWRNLWDVVHALQQARAVGCKTIGITDSRLSPLARLADYPFLVVTDGVAHGLSPAAAVSLLNAFVAALSLRMPEQVVESLRRLDAAYRRGQLLTE